MHAVSRYPEIDMIRGIAILMMILFHTVFDLSFFRVSAIDVSTGFWRYFAFSTAALFLLVVGISLTLSHARASASLSGYRLARKFLYRGAGIFLIGLLVTAGTWLYLKEGFIVFGILHLIGISVMISPIFFRFKLFNIIPGLFFIVIGFFLTTVTGPIWLLPLGVHPATFWSVDYEPVFPWTGIVLIGMGLGEYLYPRGVRKFTLPRIPTFFIQPLASLGRYSLIIYLVHQPIIILLLAAVFGIPLI
jgi:uncharacterized membrane protein